MKNNGQIQDSRFKRQKCQDSGLWSVLLGLWRWGRPRGGACGWGSWGAGDPKFWTHKVGDVCDTYSTDYVMN